MSIVNSTLICIGIELAFYLNLIPNNSKYKSRFSNSNLNMAIISLDGKTKYTTNVFDDIPKKILDDINNNSAKETYKNKNIIKLQLDGIFDIKMIHIINTICTIKKKRRVYKNERTSNRRTYDNCYE